MGDPPAAIREPRIVGVARVIPDPAPDSGLREDQDIAEIGMREAIAYEQRMGRLPEKMSRSKTSAMTSAPPTSRCCAPIEVKARSRTGVGALTPNEWLMAHRLGDEYWLYVVENAATAPNLHRVQNPSAKFKADEILEIVRYVVSDWKQAAETMPEGRNLQEPGIKDGKTVDCNEGYGCLGLRKWRREDISEFPMNDDLKKRLIEANFPLSEVSSLSGSERGRSGHISTLHIWWARRPLSASSATALAALLMDDVTKRDEYLQLVKDIFAVASRLERHAAESAPSRKGAETDCRGQRQKPQEFSTVLLEAELFRWRLSV